MNHLSKQVILKPKEERRILSGHQWVFSNEVRETKGIPATGDVVELLTAGGNTVGVGLYHQHSLIAVRLLAPSVETIDEEFFRKRIMHALELRRKLFPQSETFRLVHSESDFLPGLVIDKFNEYLSVQTFSYGMDLRLGMICDVLEAILHPTGIVERNESAMRELEQLPQKKSVLRGTIAPTVVDDCGVHFEVNLLEGQKTGFFLDQRENRHAIRRFSHDAEVLDCFTNDGGFALHAAASGAKHVMGIDSSGEAIARATHNAKLNHLGNVEFVQADVFDELKKLTSAERTFDVIVLDPPSFTKSRKNVLAAKQGYKELHASAVRLLRAGGVLLTSSCSHHIEPDVFLEIVITSAQKAGRAVQLLDWRGASPDHPVLPVMSETRYLKFAVVRVL